MSTIAPLTVITKFGGLRKAYYEALPEFDRFGESWLKRNERCTIAAVTMTSARIPLMATTIGAGEVAKADAPTPIPDVQRSATAESS